jgi:hypothetical protein
MPYSISTSQFSFVQFAESDTIQACNFSNAAMCLPVFADEDVWFQFIITGTTQEEIDALCADIGLISLGLVQACTDGFLIEFSEKPQRYRISSTKVLYIWQHGVPNFSSVLNIGECFHIKIEVADQSFCSNCFQRIGDDCHTSVIQYSNQENAFDFNYCASADSSQSADQSCDPIEIQFTNQATMVIPWTAYLQERFGNSPTIQVWVLDENGELVAAGLRVAMDTFPPTEIRIDFGGVSSGVVKIM